MEIIVSSTWVEDQTGRSTLEFHLGMADTPSSTSISEIMRWSARFNGDRYR
jgi:hypothetical protein